jgi:hypothetical protein
MRKSLFIAPIIALALATSFFVISGLSQTVRETGLELTGPTSCPDGGCAAGQRLNFTVEFAVNNGYEICFYASEDDFIETDSIEVDPTGILSSNTYNVTEGATNTYCLENVEESEVLLASATAQADEDPDQLNFSLNIDTIASNNGSVIVKIINPAVSPDPTAPTYTKAFDIASLASTVYIANTPDVCSAYSPCFVNSLEDEDNGMGTALRDAVRAVDPSDTINVLGNYTIKDHTVLIDKQIVLSGYLDSKITYAGSNCDSPMVAITNGATVKDLNIDDGSCASPSRTLIQVDSPLDVQIEHNTLENGKYAVEIQRNDGDVNVVFNEILNNASNGIASFSGTGGGVLWITANNIINNGSGNQVICNSAGNADHNYWGEDELAGDNVVYCAVSNTKQLGAPILPSSNAPGVEAILKNVGVTKSYIFDNKLAVSHSAGVDYNLILVNHGQNIPFHDAVGDSITACSNYYDVFTADGSAPSNLELSLKYDLNATCLNTIESKDYCGDGDSTKFPLWWYDPANNVTDGWDTVGQSPDGSGAAGAQGQSTSCNTSANEITVTIDNTGRPALANDLNFTPFFAGYPDQSGIDLSQFEAAFDVTQDVIKWTTTEERGIKGFHILRADSQSGPYSRISSLIDAIGDTTIGGIYTYADKNITYTRTYYYKLEVIDSNGASIETYGPINVLTSTATPTTTPTRTPTVTRTPRPTRTSTPYYYRSPTSYYRPATATPRGVPTRVRTYGPTSSATVGTKPPYNPTDSDAYPVDEGYPIETVISQMTQGYPAPGNDQEQTPTPTPLSTGASDSTDRETDNNGPTDSDENPAPDGDEPVTSVRWVFLILGGISGFVMLGVAGIVLAKTSLI